MDCCHQLTFLHCLCCMLQVTWGNVVCVVVIQKLSIWNLMSEQCYSNQFLPCCVQLFLDRCVGNSSWYNVPHVNVFWLKAQWTFITYNLSVSIIMLLASEGQFISVIDYWIFISWLSCIGCLQYQQQTILIRTYTKLKTNLTCVLEMAFSLY
jgi:hypothetical protein